MSQERAAEGPRTEDPAVGPLRSCAPFQEDREGVSSVPGLTPDLPGASSGALVWAGSGKRAFREEARGDASSQAGGAAGAGQGAEGSGTKACLVVLELQARGQSQDAIPDPRLHRQVPAVPAQGTLASKRLQISLHDILVESQSRNLGGLPVGLPDGAPVGRQGPAGAAEASCPRPREATEARVTSLGCDGRSPTLSKEEPPKRGLPSSPGPATSRARKNSRMDGALSQGGEGAGGVLWLGHSSGEGSPRPVGGPPEDANVEPLGGPRSPLFSTWPGDPGGSWMASALPASGNGTQPGSPHGPFGLLLPGGGHSPRPAPQEPPQSPALCWGVSGEASAEPREAERVVGAGSDCGLAPSYNQEELEVEAQPVSRGRRGQGAPAATDTCAGSVELLGCLGFPPEPAASKAPTDPFGGRRRSQCAKMRSRPAPQAQVPDAGRSSGNANQDQPEESSSGGCAKLEQVEMPHGVKHVCYLGSGAVIRLLGAIGHGQAGGPQPPKLEALEDLTETKSASPAQRLRRKQLPRARRPAGSQLLAEAAGGLRPWFRAHWLALRPAASFRTSDPTPRWRAAIPSPQGPCFLLHLFLPQEAGAERPGALLPQGGPVDAEEEPAARDREEEDSAPQC
ncbi:SPOC domain-containing protein 1-like [Dasypus novemcinctus]|uniref:SPOC domain-containing protein 1-like n=1 Tax=Dasypus novemcinctus TaxID=9361 RepID=UPI0039C9EFED